MCHFDECRAMTISRTTLSLNPHGLLTFLASIIMSGWVPQITHCYADYHSA
jgi:hypothetical protein